jgi:hypothetical protein
MKLTLVRYKTKSERALENQHLIEKVFEELRQKSLPGVRYVALKLDDGSFVHFYLAEAGASPLSTLDTFKAFQDGIRDRCLEQPRVEGFNEATIVGAYRMLSG